MGWTMAHDDKRDGTAVLREHHPSIHPHPTHPSIHPSIHPRTHSHHPCPCAMPMYHVPCSALQLPCPPPVLLQARPFVRYRIVAKALPSLLRLEAALPLRGLSCVFIFFYLILI